MNFSLETIEELVSRLTIKIPMASIEREISARIRALEWCPLCDEKEQDADVIRKHIISGVINSSFLEAVSHFNLTPANDPQFGPETVINDMLTFVADVDVLPKLTTDSYENIQISRPTADITEEDVDHLLSTLRNQHKQSGKGKKDAAIDLALRKQFGVAKGGEAELRVEIRKHLELQLDKAIRMSVTLQVLDALLEKNPFSPPQAKVKKDYDDRLIAMRKQNPTASFPAPQQIMQHSSLTISRTFIIQAVIKAENITVLPKDVRTGVENIASNNKDPEKVIKEYYSNNLMLMQVADSVMREKAIDCILNKATIINAPSSYSQIVQSLG